MFSLDISAGCDLTLCFNLFFIFPEDNRSICKFNLKLHMIALSISRNKGE